MSSINDVARKAGVSVATVSRLFNRAGKVRRQTQQRILAVARSLDYAPRKWKRQTKPAIAMIINAERGGLALDTYDKEMLVAVSRSLMVAGALFELVPVGEVDLVRNGAYQGAITILHRGFDPALFKGLARLLPIVHVNQPALSGLSVCSDHAQGVFRAMEHLFQSGHRRVGILTRSMPLHLNVVQDLRLQGYLDAVERLKLDADPNLVIRSKGGMLESLVQCFKAQPTALMAVGGEDSGAPLMYNLHLLDKRVPDDVSVITYENPRVSPYLIPPHTTIAQDMDQIGQMAVQILMDRLQDKAPAAKHAQVPCKLIERESVRNLTGR